MVLAWTCLIPMGVVVARFYKVLPKQDWPRELDSQFWWIAHRLFQYGGIAAAVAAVYLLWDEPAQKSSALLVWHVWLGWVVMVLCGLQVLGAWLRGSKGGPVDAQAWPDSPIERGDHYDMTRRRRVFEYVHINVGYVLVLLAALTTGLGLSLSGAPVWMWLLLGFCWLVLILCFIALERRDRRVSTYKAIWGPSEHHPGNNTAS